VCVYVYIYIYIDIYIHTLSFLFLRVHHEGWTRKGEIRREEGGRWGGGRDSSDRGNRWEERSRLSSDLRTYLFFGDYEGYLSHCFSFLSFFLSFSVDLSFSPLGEKNEPED